MLRVLQPFFFSSKDIGNNFFKTFSYFILQAYSFPHVVNNHLGSNEAIFDLITAQVRSVLIDTHAMSPAQIVCADRYNYQSQSINNDLTNQTNTCFDNANRTTTDNNVIANATVDSIKKDLFTVQWQLSNCTNQNDTNLFVNCTTATVSLYKSVLFSKYF